MWPGRTPDSTPVGSQNLRSMTDEREKLSAGESAPAIPSLPEITTLYTGLITSAGSREDFERVPEEIISKRMFRLYDYYWSSSINRVITRDVFTKPTDGGTIFSAV